MINNHHFLSQPRRSFIYENIERRPALETERPKEEVLAQVQFEVNSRLDNPDNPENKKLALQFEKDFGANMGNGFLSIVDYVGETVISHYTITKNKNGVSVDISKFNPDDLGSDGKPRPPQERNITYARLYQIMKEPAHDVIGMPRLGIILNKAAPASSAALPPLHDPNALPAWPLASEEKPPAAGDFKPLPEAGLPDPHASFKGIFDKLQSMPEGAPLGTKLNHQFKNGEEFLKDQLRALNAPDLQAILKKPFISLSKEEKGRVHAWQISITHYIESGVGNSKELANQLMDYVMRNLDTDFHEMESHPFDMEAVLADYFANDPRFKKLMEVRFKRGKKSEADKLVNNKSPFNPDLPASEDLSFAMELAAKTNVPYNQKFIRINDQNGKGFELSPRDLAHIAETYFISLHESAKKRESDTDDGSALRFVEDGCHTVDGVLHLLKKYETAMQIQDPALYAKLVKETPGIIGGVMRSATPKGSAENNAALRELGTEFNYAGHMLEAILDENAAPVFVVGDKRMTGRQIFEKYGTNLLNLPKPTASATDLDTLHLFALILNTLGEVTIRKYLSAERNEKNTVIPRSQISHAVAALRALEPYINKPTVKK